MLVKKYGGEGFISLAEEPKKEYFIMSQEDRKLIISTLFINTRETEFVTSQFILTSTHGILELWEVEEVNCSLVGFSLLSIVLDFS